MKYKVIPISSDHISFIDSLLKQSDDVIHGGRISYEEWYDCLVGNPDPYEINFIITAGDENAAWIKLNGLNSDDIWISMLIVAKEYRRMGTGDFCIRFAENFARRKGKKAIRIQTTEDNLTATKFYLKQGYKLEKNIRYAVGDGVVRNGFQFKKDLEAKY